MKVALYCIEAEPVADDMVQTTLNVAFGYSFVSLTMYESVHCCQSCDSTDHIVIVSFFC